ncbi:3976_t:CDS:2 [Acaulospora colombiana]|uniref:3976_t:CDS:1 n=1 Tax=Acaulospora colombiana TaxID=27376 RepID=A0ACA9LWK0_9GLOM|nr:3976_t:CDS:2 [Acaulospora colombiana]
MDPSSYTLVHQLERDVRELLGVVPVPVLLGDADACGALGTRGIASSYLSLPGLSFSSSDEVVVVVEEEWTRRRERTVRRQMNSLLFTAWARVQTSEMALISLKIASNLDSGLFAVDADDEASVQPSAPIDERALIVFGSYSKVELQSIMNPFVGYTDMEDIKTTSRDYKCTHQSLVM